MILPPKCSCRSSLTFFRSICIHSVLECNYYKALGLNPSATHAEIKSAYYELSKKHHPDKNQGSEKSAKIFRDITAAYEVLGNEKSRKQYDREQLFTRKSDGSSFQSSTHKPDYSDDLDRIFYERRRKFYTTRNYERTPYDFDAWYRAHYVTYKNFYETKNKYKYSKNQNSSHYQEQYKTNKERSNAANIIRKRKIAVLIYFLGIFLVALYSPKIKNINDTKNS